MFVSSSLSCFVWKYKVPDLSQLKRPGGPMQLSAEWVIEANWLRASWEQSDKSGNIETPSDFWLVLLNLNHHLAYVLQNSFWLFLQPFCRTVLEVRFSEERACQAKFKPHWGSSESCGLEVGNMETPSDGGYYFQLLKVVKKNQNHPKSKVVPRGQLCGREW